MPLTKCGLTLIPPPARPPQTAVELKHRRRSMKTLISVCILAAAITLCGSALQQGIGTNGVLAQSSACVQNCQNVRQWPAAQCQAYCAKQERKSPKGK